MTPFLMTPFLSHRRVGRGRTERRCPGAIEKARKIEPALSIGFMRERSVGMHESTLKGVLDSLRKAGVPA